MNHPVRPAVTSVSEAGAPNLFGQAPSKAACTGVSVKKQVSCKRLILVYLFWVSFSAKAQEAGFVRGSHLTDPWLLSWRFCESIPSQVPGLQA